MDLNQNIREVVLDTETTGLSYENGDRIVEIGCVELINHAPTNRVYQTYINPERTMGAGAVRVTGYDDNFLKGKPFFSEIVDDFLNFVKGSRLVIHNAPFDIGFLNSELRRLNKPLFRLEEVVDTLEIAKRKYPGSPVNLDALCRRFEIDTSSRGKHGALIDSFLLADVYINLLGGKQSGLVFDASDGFQKEISKNTKQFREKRDFPASEEELQKHEEFLMSLKNALWNH